MAELSYPSAANYPSVRVRFISGNQSQIDIVHGISVATVKESGELYLYGPNNEYPVMVYGRGNWISFHKVVGKEA